MKIGLVDVDGKDNGFPNLALMKIAAYHKAQGDEVEWANPMFGKYDKVYKSKVFTFSEDDGDIYDCEVIKGGTGYDIHAKLPAEIDAMRIIYCDPPYKGVKKYSYSIDHDYFWNWCRKQVELGHKVFVSEYQAPEDFVCVWEQVLTNSMHQTNTKKPIERLFIHKSQKL